MRFSEPLKYLHIQGADVREAFEWGPPDSPEDEEQRAASDHILTALIAAEEGMIFPDDIEYATS